MPIQIQLQIQDRKIIYYKKLFKLMFDEEITLSNFENFNIKEWGPYVLHFFLHHLQSFPVVQIMRNATIIQNAPSKQRRKGREDFSPYVIDKQARMVISLKSLRFY
jgi:hypothetical protein